MTSHPWRERVLDPRLWKQLYRSQGWGIETHEVVRFQDELRGYYTTKLGDRRLKQRRVESEEEDHHLRHKARSQAGSLFGTVREGPHGWNRQHDTVEADGSVAVMSDVTTSSNDNDEMQDVNYHTSAPSSQPLAAVPSLFNSNNNNNTASLNSASADEDEMYPSPPASSREPVPRSSFASIISAGGSIDPLQIKPSLTTPLAFGTPRMNWHHLYKQRKKLEDNWDKGRYINFQLPHPDHNDEAHSECIYTIQYSRNYLVSGSRDKTLRIWDLKTRRLLKKPLEGHTASVLCLQFDESKEEDVIISGSSDTSVIIWRFSTGQIVRKMEKAHKESVLNLRFDKKFLVTCSKDRTIKVWCRRVVEPGDNNFPGSETRQNSTYTLNMSKYPVLVTQPRQPNKLFPITPYTHLKTLAGHSAAVNAIQLYGDEVVSASGDRTIKVWSLVNGNCIQTVQGHTKGIACIQFDGRRIVSGSSDNTVRIFDKVTGAEVACLTGHSNLVRTVQAGFGDLPGGGEDDEEEAREIDKRYFRAKMIEEEAAAEEGGIVQTHKMGHQPRNAGSKDPRDIMAYGAKLPPGGGGSRFGRIVSGSYDETIIIWKRDDEGKWVPSHRLRQDAALRAAESAAQQRSRQQTQYHQALNYVPTHYPANTPPPTSQNAFAYLTHYHQQNPMQHAQQNAAPLQQQPNPPAAQQQLQPPPGPQLQHNIPGQQSGPPVYNPIQNIPPPIAPPQPQGQAQAQAQPQTQAQAQAQTPASHVQQQVHQPVIMNNPNGIHGGNGRVFKLQFDARMIICCSQDPRI
ncbi:hypothetical protein GP486_007439, partial [Trichoglossum hirsutum]